MDPESTSGGYSFVMKDTNWEGQPNEVAHRMVSGRVPSFPALTPWNQTAPLLAQQCARQPASSTERPCTESSLEPPPYAGSWRSGLYYRNKVLRAHVLPLFLLTPFSSWAKGSLSCLPVTLQLPVHTWPGRGALHCGF